MILPDCKLCKHKLSMVEEDSSNTYIIAYCNNNICAFEEIPSYTAKFANNKLLYESFIMNNLFIQFYHNKNITLISRMKKSKIFDNYDKVDQVSFNKILPLDYDKIKLYLTLS